MKKILPAIVLVMLLASQCQNSDKNDTNIGKRIIDTTQTATKENRSREEIVLHPKFDTLKLHGLGIFKIGVTIENSVGQLLKSKKYWLDSIWTERQYEDVEEISGLNHCFHKIKHPRKISESGIGGGSSSLYNWCNDVTTFALKNYDVDGLEIQGLFIYYYNNQLVRLEWEEEGDVNLAIEDKYGKPNKYETVRDEVGNLYRLKYTNGDIESGVGLLTTKDNHMSFIGPKDSHAFLDIKSLQALAVLSRLDSIAASKRLKNL